jgi:hypothetical protein
VDMPNRRLEIVEAFVPFDRARLAHSSEPLRAAQLAARQLIYEYIDQLWRDIDRSGESPSGGEKYQAVRYMLDLAKVLRGTAFESLYGSEGESQLAH